MIPSYRPELGSSELTAIGKVFDSRWLGAGDWVAQFEQRLQTLLGSKHVVAVSSGTAALHVALLGIGIGQGHEVLVPSMTHCSAIQAILATGATPRFCEVLPETLNLDSKDAAARITPKTKAIMPVHYGGNACEMEPIVALAQERDMVIIDDAAHAFGSSYRGCPVGRLAHVTCFSFDPIKNITCGEGGAVVTESDEVAERVRILRMIGIDTDSWNRQGQRGWDYTVVSMGFRYHLNNLHAAIGLAQLDRFGEFKAKKQMRVRRYDAALSKVPGIQLLERNVDECFPFNYVIRVPGGRRDRLARQLFDAGIHCMVQFIPNHLQPAFANYATSLPRTEMLYEEILTIPLFTEMTDPQQEFVIDHLQAFLGHGEYSSSRKAA
ncbi:MAG: DegT/DnrJ/EryC1/StrS family aminotransferase [Pirellulaceae bacterium]